jgi:hypothetical protein
LSNVDIHYFGNIVSKIEPESTLWIVVSKSYITADTIANANLTVSFMKEKGLDPSKHYSEPPPEGYSYRCSQFRHEMKVNEAIIDFEIGMAEFASTYYEGFMPIVGCLNCNQETMEYVNA